MQRQCRLDLREDEDLQDVHKRKLLPRTSLHVLMKVQIPALYIALLCSALPQGFLALFPFLLKGYNALYLLVQLLELVSWLVCKARFSIAALSLVCVCCHYRHVNASSDAERAKPRCGGVEWAGTGLAAF